MRMSHDSEEVSVFIIPFLELHVCGGVDELILEGLVHSPRFFYISFLHCAGDLSGLYGLWFHLLKPWGILLIR